MYILGLNAFHGDSSACIFKDDHFICALEEERIRRIKHWAGFPSKAIEFCLKEAGISINNVDYVTVSREPKAHFWRKIAFLVTHPRNIFSVGNRVTNALKIASLEETFEKEFLAPGEKLKAEIINVEHHLSHLASTFFASPFKEAALLSIDAFGDFASTMRGFGNDKDIKVIDQVYYPHSLGAFYTAMTQYLGFYNYGDEYKVMGLAPYGKPIYAEKLRKLIIADDNGLFHLDERYYQYVRSITKTAWAGGYPAFSTMFSSELCDLLGPARQKGDELTQYHRDLASSTQFVTEEIISHMLCDLYKKTNCDNVCIAGGCAQNSVANGKVRLLSPFKNVYIPPAGHDAGTCMGSALYLYNSVLKQKRIEPIRHAYWGSCFTNEEIEKFLKSQNAKYRYFDNDGDLYEHVAAALLNAGVIGWFQGRAEFGPRALGNRSILVDPRRSDAKDLLNEKIKRRESFRPFAPSILKEYCAEYFEQIDDVPFMEKVFQIREEKREALPAVTHVDGSGRLQTVDANASPRYHALISTFFKYSGVPVLLNTSFNENEPIVNTPAEAYDCFARTKMDMLVLGNFVVTR